MTASDSPNIALDPNIPTSGQLLRGRGDHSSYLGKRHLSHGNRPDMVSYGCTDWEGDDKEYQGNANPHANFDDDLHTKPEVERAWLLANETAEFG